MNDFFQKLLKEQKFKKSFLCVGLDPHLEKMPKSMGGDRAAVLPFLKDIVDHTHPYACCFKPQIAYFSAFGLEEELAQIIEYIHDNHPQCPVILDAKRSDIGSTADMYALEAFKRYQADAVTANPYMGGDTLAPFTQFKDKGVFVLCRTSNEGAKEFQNLTVGDGQPLYTFVAERAMNFWNKNGNVGLVIGATAIKELRKVRERFPEAWFLVPGIGAQGGDLEAVIEYGRKVDNEGGLIINSARAILYASEHDDYAQKAGDEARKLQEIMARVF